MQKSKIRITAPGSSMLVRLGVVFLFFLTPTTACVPSARSVPSNVIRPLAAPGSLTWSLVGPGDADWTTVITVSKKGVVYAGFDIGGLYKSMDGGATWTPINNGITNYYIYDIEIDPNDENVLWSATRGAIFKSIDGGANWAAKRNGIGGPSEKGITAPISSVAVDQSNSQIVYAGVGDTRHWTDGHGTIFKSVNGGDSWTVTSIGSSTNIVCRVAIDPKNPQTVYAATAEGHFKSTNGGDTWAARNSGLRNSSVRFVAVAPNDPSVLYLTVDTDNSPNWNGGVYKSINGGQTWKKVNGGLSQDSGGGGDNYYWLAIDPSDSRIVYVTNQSYLDTSGVWKTTDGGASWNKSSRWSGKGNGNTTYGWRTQSNLSGTTVALDPSKPSRIYMGSTSQIIKSEDGGDTWEQIYTNKVENSSPAPWTHRGLDVLGAARATTVDPRDSRRIFAGTGDHGLLKSEDGGHAWRLISEGTGMRLGSDVPAVVVDPGNSAVVWAADNAVLTDNSGGLAVSTDYGESWTQINKGIPDAHVNAIVLDPKSPPGARTLYVISQGNGVYKSTDSGRSWTAVIKGLPENELVQLAISPSNPETLYTAVEETSDSPGGVWKTTDGAKHWSKVNTATTLADVRVIAIDPGNSGVLYAGLRQTNEYDGGVYKSVDGGISWVRILDDPRIEAVVALPGQSGVIYAASQDDNYHDESSGRGIYRSTDGGNTWNLVNDGLAVLRFWNLSFDPKPPYTIYASSNGSGVYVMTDPVFVHPAATAPAQPSQ